MKRSAAQAHDSLTGAAAPPRHRFLDIHGDDVADMRTGAAGDARYVSDLVVRGLAQTRDHGRITALLDILDRLLELGVYGVDRAIDGALSS